MNENLVLSCHNLSKFFGNNQAVKNISFQLSRGQIVGLLGLNGAGKTTTLSMICGVVPPSEGTISICNYSLRDQPIKSKEQIGFLPDQLPLYKELTVQEYLTYCATLRRVKKNKIKEAVNYVMDRCGITARADQLVGQLSRGYQQRTAIAQAIVHSPTLVVLDEPTSGLDPVQIQHIRDLILELRKEHTVIISTHLLYEAELLCDRILIIHNGEILLDKEKSQLAISTPTVLVTFGHPPTLAELQNLPSITSAQAITDTQFKITFSPLPADSDNYNELLSHSVTHAWNILEITRQHTNVEAVFLQLTSS
ncbi:MAG: ABC transporter ATP-binding protein [Methylacidiphilales bacterium]|nr:ABC transporter ATP-binding protein [Candidatus Methylacidiphilales bacterium]